METTSAYDVFSKPYLVSGKLLSCDMEGRSTEKKTLWVIALEQS